MSPVRQLLLRSGELPCRQKKLCMAELTAVGSLGLLDLQLAKFKYLMRYLYFRERVCVCILVLFYSSVGMLVLVTCFTINRNRPLPGSFLTLGFDSGMAP